jgi:hypothetical protein
MAWVFNTTPRLVVLYEIDNGFSYTLCKRPIHFSRPNFICREDDTGSNRKTGEHLLNDKKFRAYNKFSPASVVQSDHLIETERLIRQDIIVC